MSIETVAIGCFFITIHLLANHLIPTDRIKKLRWLSLSGGFAVGYVFIYILPSLHREQKKLDQEHTSLFTMESELYFIGLLGLVVFFGVQKIVSNNDTSDHNGHFWLHTIFFMIYNMLIAYTVIASNVQGIQAFFYAAAIGMHFIAVAHDLWRENPEKYTKVGRFVIASGIFIGWLIGVVFQLSSFFQSIIFAFISGAMILNVLKNELPNDKDAHFPTFTIAIIFYTVVTLSLKYFFEW